MFRQFLLKAIKTNETYKCTLENCPLAIATGYATDGISYSHYSELLENHHSIYLKGIVKTLPDWAQKFVTVFDAVTGDAFYSGKVFPKNAKTALLIIDNKIRRNDETGEWETP